MVFFCSVFWPALSQSLFFRAARVAVGSITLLLGVVGALLGGWIGGLIFNTGLQEFFSLTTWLLAIGGSIIVLLIYGLVTGRKATMADTRTTTPTATNSKASTPRATTGRPAYHRKP